MKHLLLLPLATLISSVPLNANSLSKRYEGCAPTKKEALYTLSGNIESRISTADEQQIVVRNNDNIQSKISSYSKVSTHLSLVNIEYTKKGEEICAFVYKDDQVQNTKKLLAQALLYDVKDLPTEIDAKIEKLTVWIANIKQLSFLLPVFLDKSDAEQERLNKKEKIFTDLYTQSIAYSESLFFKSCKKREEDAKKALNKKLFTEVKEDKKGGFLSSISSFFSFSKTEDILSMFDEQLITLQKENKTCVMLKKKELLNISKNMYADILRVSKTSLSKDPKKRYKEIATLYDQIKVTQILMKLFPSYYKKNNFEQLNKSRKLLSEIKKSTHPQYVLFHISGAEDITLTLDNNTIKNNEKYYIRNGNHTYKITAKGRCPIVKSFDIDLFDDKSISTDLDSYTYPTVVFVTDKDPNIIVNGHVIKANVTSSIKKCTDESRYIVKYAGQSISGTIDTNPGDTNTVELNFLTPQELSVFNDAKTKNFSAISETSFSESLTPVYSDNFKFTIDKEPTHGSLTLHKDGSFEYISKKDFAGVDSFHYKIETPQKTSTPKLVNIQVMPSKKMPIEKKERPKKSIQKETKKEPAVSYEDFKMYVLSKKLTEDFLQKVKKKFPDYFERLRKEMTHQ